MRYVFALLAAFLVLSVSSEAQEYRCENGELIGGNTGVTARCATNKAGQIISVTPYQSATRQTVRIYPGDQVRSQSVQTYTQQGRRAYAPTPLTAQRRAPPESISLPHRTLRAVSPAATHTIVRRSAFSNMRATQPHIIQATPTPRIQRSAYTAPCNFRVREVSRGENHNFYEVCHTDIEPKNKHSIRKLYSRLKKASRRACGTDYDSILTRWSEENRSCAAASLDRAVMISGIASLQSYHFSKTGRSLPRVTVGSPRDAS